MHTFSINIIYHIFLQKSTVFQRLLRIIIFVQSRSRFFVRLYENDDGILDVFRGVFGQSDGKDASE